MKMLSKKLTSANRILLLRSGSLLSDSLSERSGIGDGGGPGGLRVTGADGIEVPVALGKAKCHAISLI